MLDDWNPKIPKSPATPFSSVSTPPASQSDEALERLRIMAKQKLASEMDSEDRENADWQGGYDHMVTEARAILPILTRELTKADAGVLHIGTMKVWRGHTPGTIFIQQDSGEGGEFPEADLEALWQSYYAENF